MRLNTTTPRRFSPLARGFGLAVLLALAVLAAAGVLAFRAVQTVKHAEEWVNHTYEVIARIEGMHVALTRAESAQRAYLLTGETEQRDVFAMAAAQARRDLDAVARLTADNASQQRRAARLRRALEQRIESLQDGVALRAAGRQAEAVANVALRGIGQMAVVRAELGQLRAEEDRLLDRRLQRSAHAAQLGLAATVGVSGLSIALLGSLGLLSAAHARRIAAEQRALIESQAQTRAKATQLREANELLRAAAQQLEDRVTERTTELAEANAELEAFARTVAHDLRAPLRNLQGYATALLEDEAPRLSEGGREYAVRLSSTTQRLDRLVTDLLEYSRVARSRLQTEPIELEAVVREVLRDFSGEIAARGARVEIDGPLPQVVAHRATLAQALSNLVGNALKFVPPGRTPQVRIGARHERGAVVLAVSDNGIGIAPEHRDRIFQVFERLHGQERYPGTGIGLAIVRKAAERMGGTVSVSEAPGGGSVFELCLPAAA